MNKRENLDIEKVALAIEADAGMQRPGIRKALADLKSGNFSGIVHTPEQILCRITRRATKHTQEDFAKAIGASLSSYRDWEQGRHKPSLTVIKLLRLIANNPDLIKQLDAA